jgi:SOS-response transcriptional repressor LexA
MTDVDIHEGDLVIVEEISLGNYRKGDLVIAKTPRGMGSTR